MLKKNGQEYKKAIALLNNNLFCKSKWNLTPSRVLLPRLPSFGTLSVQFQTDKEICAGNALDFVLTLN